MLFCKHRKPDLVSIKFNYIIVFCMTLHFCLKSKEGSKFDFFLKSSPLNFSFHKKQFHFKTNNFNTNCNTPYQIPPSAFDCLLIFSAISGQRLLSFINSNRLSKIEQRRWKTRLDLIDFPEGKFGPNDTCVGKKKKNQKANLNPNLT